MDTYAQCKHVLNRHCLTRTLVPHTANMCATISVSEPPLMPNLYALHAEESVTYKCTNTHFMFVKRLWSMH